MAKKTPAEAVLDRVREVAYAFSGAEEKLSHGAPWFHVRGKMFLAYVDDHHGDGRLGVWCKATFETQRRLVADDPARYFVPPYVGVKGWVGVRLEGASADWAQLAILVEEAWLSVAPPKLVRAGTLREGPAPKPPKLAKTDPKVASRALERLTRLCVALPEVTCERQASHASYAVRKKSFAYFLDGHHGDGVIGVCLRGEKRETAKLVKGEPARFYVPAYLGAHGWLGIRLDGKGVDWDFVAARVEASYRGAAPKTLVRALDEGA